jgi:hypothetical protein
MGNRKSNFELKLLFYWLIIPPEPTMVVWSITLVRPGLDKDFRMNKKLFFFNFPVVPGFSGIAHHAKVKKQ